MFTKVLLAHDGSKPAAHALSVAVATCRAFGAELHVCHTPQIDTPPIVVGSFVGAIDVPPTLSQIEEAGTFVMAEVEEAIRSAGGTLAKAHVGRGSPTEHVLNVAEEIGADLIVMGRRGLGAFGALALGSVSIEVSKRSERPVLTVA